jgi:hypothetical protein
MESGSRCWRQRAHGVEGDEDVLVVGAVVGGVLDLVAQQADDGEGLAFDLHDLADRRIAVEELFRGVRAEDHDLAMLGEVGGLEVAALFDVELAHAAVGQVDGLGLDVHHLGPILHAEAAVGLAGDGAQEGQAVAHGLGVAVAQLDALPGALAAGLHGGLPAPHHDDVVADAEEALQHGAAQRLAVAEQQHHGDQSPHDAEHGEAGAHAVAAQRLDGFGDGFVNAQSSWLLRI